MPEGRNRSHSLPIQGERERLLKDYKERLRQSRQVGSMEQSTAVDASAIAEQLERAENAAKNGTAQLMSAELFDLSKAQSSGGVTGSVRAPLITTDGSKGHYYQFKSTILNSSERLRKIKAGYTDRENLGEVIAAKISMALLNTPADHNNAPSVHIVYDKQNKTINVASRYLDNVKGTLDSYLAEDAELGKSGKKHIRIVSAYDKSQHQAGSISADHEKVKPLKKSIAQAIAASALVGDHDVNPGNIMVVGTADGGVRAARIDFGHALNDLLNAPSAFGGNVKDSEHPILDFFNRAKVAGGRPGGDPSKLWRDYPGLMPSEELAEALAEVSETAFEKIDSGIESANQEFQQLLSELHKNQDYSGIVHLFKSMNAMYSNFTGESLDIPSEKEIKAQGIEQLSTRLKEAFDGVGKKCQAHAKDMQHVSKLMKIQAAVDQQIIAAQTGDDAKQQACATVIKETLEEMGLSEDTPVSWVRTDAKVTPVTGSFNDYFASREKYLSSHLQARQQEDAVIDKVQSLMDQRLELEALLVENFHIDVAEMLRLSPDDKHLMESHAEITVRKMMQEITEIKAQLNELQPEVDKIAKRSKGNIQWKATTISTKDGNKDFPPFKGTMDEYIDGKRLNLNIIAETMLKRSSDYSAKIDKQFMSSLRKGIKKQATIQAGVSEVAELLKGGNLDDAQGKFQELKAEYSELYGDKQTTGKKVIDELERDLEQAVEANRSTTPTGP